MAGTAIGLLGPSGKVAMAATDTDLVASCRGVLAATEPATRRVWLERDLFAYELRAALGGSSDEMRIYRANLRETCARVDYNNHLLRVRSQQARAVWPPAS
ncbi:hypothetical protein [Solimonas soli]|uniref:hypothetical protein n=1 Tax=Solimonas soli TaxID=413479 RepID=UPI00048994A8|nr:hypothetical protein [Solimonas soli]